MLKRDFLEKPYDYMNDILLFLYNNKGQATRNELVDFFNISLPTLNEYLSFLEQFLKEEQLQENLTLTVLGDTLYLNKASTFSMKAMIMLFLDKSIKFHMVQQLFHKNEINGGYFQQNYAISSATYYRKIVELNDLLNEFNLRIKRGKLVGEEKQIRFFFFNFFWFIFEEKTDLEKELANQYLGLIEILQEIPRITFDHTEILQIKLWMKISFRRMVLEPLPTISPHDVQLDRPLFEEINLSIHTYMKRIDRPYTINEAYMFYDFFCSMHNYSANAAFAFRLAKQQRIEKTYLNEMNRVILTYLKARGYLSHYVLPIRLLYIENLLFQLHAQLYYFSGFILPFDYWTIQSLLKVLRHPFSESEVYELVEIATTNFATKVTASKYQNQFTEINYTLILNHIAELNEKKITIGVYHSLSSAYSELVAQKIQQSIAGKYPLKIEPYNAENHYDLLLMNTNNEQLVAQYDHYYIFSDISNRYDLQSIEKIIQLLLGK